MRTAKIFPFKKTVRLGTMKSHGGRWMSIFCTVEYKPDGELTISGVEGPLSSGGCVGSFGQIGTHLRDQVTQIKPAPGWSPFTLARFFVEWQYWHLNHMKAGSPAQRAFLADFPITANHYKDASAALHVAGLNPDPNYIHEGKPYVYGSAWLKETIPQQTLAFLKNLPDADKSIPYAWRH